MIKYTKKMGSDTMNNNKAEQSYDVSLFDSFSENIQLNTCFSFIVLLKGELKIIKNDIVTSLKAREILYIAPQEHYSLKFDNNTGSIAAFIRFQYPFFVKHGKGNTQKIYSHVISDSHEFHQNLFDRTIKFIDQALYTKKDDATSSQLFVFDYIEYLRKQLCEDASVNLTGDSKVSRINNIRFFIENNFMSQISLNELAKQLALTPQYLATFIKKNMNTTFNQYLYNVRLTHAANDLINTRGSITQIAFNYGFPNSSTFNKLFKEKYHTTPQKFRSNHERMLKEKNYENDILFDIAKSRQLFNSYKIYLQNNSGSKKTHTEIFLTDKQISVFPNIWQKVLNLRFSKDIFNRTLFNHIKETLPHLPFEYGRIHAIIHPDNMPYIKEQNKYDFQIADSTLDILMELGLKPFIVLGKPDPIADSKGNAVNSHSADSYLQFPDALRKFIKHCIERYGAENVAQWMFEFSSFGLLPSSYDFNENYDIFIKNSTAAYRIIKELTPKSRFGGPNHPLAHSSELVLNIFDDWKEKDVKPDFVTTLAYPLNDNNNETESRQATFSTSPHINRQRMIKFKEQIQKSFGQDIPVYITELAFHFQPHKALSDSRFSATYIVQNVLDLYDLCESISLPAFSDRQYLPTNSDYLLNGYNGILSVDGIKKPPYFALMQLSNCGKTLLNKYNNALVTRHSDNSYRVLLYNYKHPTTHYCTHFNALDVTADNFDDMFTDKSPRTFSISLKNLPRGKYFIFEYLLSKNHGSLWDKCTQCSCGSRLNKQVITHLKLRTLVDFSYQEVSVEENTVIPYTLEPHDILLISIFPEDSDNY